MLRSILIAAAALGCLTLSASPAFAAAPPYYPPVEWIPAAAGNYSVGRGGAAITTIVIHETDGSYLSAVHWFQNPRSRTSAHYLVRAWDGAIAQFVAESDMAYHVRSANPYTIGIEHEFWPRYGIWHTDAQYRASAQLTCAIARHYGIPIDRQHIVGHRELPGQDHTDPGPSWNWDYYMSLVRSCASSRAEGVARATSFQPSELDGAAKGPLVFGDQNPNVALLQWNLAYLGFMNADDLTAGSGNFGSLTRDAVSSFQTAKGLEATGDYGAPSVAVMVTSLSGALAGLPTISLDVGLEQDEVTQVQTALNTLGYMDLVTGYYGPMTLDAITRFQQDNGIDTTGMYDSVTRMALAVQLKHAREAAAAAQPVPGDATPELSPSDPLYRTLSLLTQ